MYNIQQFKKLYCKNSDKITWSIGIIIIVLTFVFLYNNFYKAVSDAIVLKNIKTQVAIEVVDIKMWEKINNGIEWKKEYLTQQKVGINPFN